MVLENRELRRILGLKNTVVLSGASGAKMKHILYPISDRVSEIIKKNVGIEVLEAMIMKSSVCWALCPVVCRK
jgi:hypothetical protein